MSASGAAMYAAVRPVAETLGFWQQTKPTNSQALQFAVGPRAAQRVWVGWSASNTATSQIKMYAWYASLNSGDLDFSLFELNWLG